MIFTVPHLREFCKIPIVNSKVIGNALNNCFTSAGAKKTKYHTFTHYSDYINSGNTNKLFLKYVYDILTRLQQIIWFKQPTHESFRT